jgi:hypothetical protein
VGVTSAEGKRTERFSENHCEEGGETGYLVRWKGYDESHDDWKKEQDILSATLDEYKEHLIRTSIDDEQEKGEGCKEEKLQLSLKKRKMRRSSVE